MKNKIMAIYTALLAMIIWLGIILQFYVLTGTYLAEGRTFGGAIIQVSSYFTIQGNTLAALSLTLILLKPESAWGRFFSKLTVLTAIAVYITIVGSVYELILRRHFYGHGLAVVANEILHRISPIFFVLFWLIFVPKYSIPWRKGLNWLIYPLIYFFYILIRGAFTGLYPYNFIDATLISYHQIFINFLLLLTAFLVVAVIFIAMGRLLKKTTN
jgi:hypothetical protein